MVKKSTVFTGLKNNFFFIKIQTFSTSSTCSNSNLLNYFHLLFLKGKRNEEINRRISLLNHSNLLDHQDIPSCKEQKQASHLQIQSSHIQKQASHLQIQSSHDRQATHGIWKKNDQKVKADKLRNGIHVAWKLAQLDSKYSLPMLSKMLGIHDHNASNYKRLSLDQLELREFSMILDSLSLCNVQDIKRDTAGEIASSALKIFKSVVKNHQSKPLDGNRNSTHLNEIDFFYSALYNWWLHILELEKKHYRMNQQNGTNRNFTSFGITDAFQNVEWMQLLMRSRGAVQICTRCADNVSKLADQVYELLNEGAESDEFQSKNEKKISFIRNYICPTTGFHVDFANLNERIIIDVVGSTHYISDYIVDEIVDNEQASTVESLSDNQLIDLSPLEIPKESTKGHEQELSANDMPTPEKKIKLKMRFVLSGPNQFKKRILEENGWKVIIVPYYKLIRKQKSHRKEWLFQEIFNYL